MSNNIQMRMEKSDPEDKPPSTPNKIKTIYLSNILEGYYKNYTGLKSAEERTFWTQYDTFDSNRALLYGDDNKVVITSSPIHPLHFRNMTHLMGWKHVYNFSPKKSSPSISADCQGDHFLKTELLRIIKENPGVALIPYRSTPQFQKLIHYLRGKKVKFETPETIPEEKQFIHNYFNTKRGFRHMWHLSDANNAPYVQIPDGFITKDKKEVIDAAWWFKQHGISFVIKYNPGTQGIGVQIIDHKKVPGEKKPFDAYMTALLKDKMWSEPVIVIEKAIPANEKSESVSPSLELSINPKGKVSPLYVSDQLLAADKTTFRGIYIYPELTNDKRIRKAFASGIKFGKKLAEYGYRGIFDIDLIRSKHNEIFVMEANLRRTGGTHLHELCLALLGKDYGNNYHSLIEDVVLVKNHSLTYEKCRALFGNELYSNKTHSGIIFANPDMLKVNILVIVLITQTREQIVALRSLIEIRLKGIIAHESAIPRDE